MSDFEDALALRFAAVADPSDDSDWLDVQRRLRRAKRRRVLTISLVAAAAVLVAAPAFALTRAVVDFFSSASAPPAAVLNFAQLGRGAPEGMDPRAIASEARVVASRDLADGSTVTLSVAPTAAGGFCYLVSRPSAALAGGCDARREIPFAPAFAAATYPLGSAILSGSILDAAAATAEIRTADGVSLDLPIVRVSTPINASFYFGEIEISRGSFPLTTTIRDTAGNLIARKTIPAPPTP